MRRSLRVVWRVGRLWERLELEPEGVVQAVHASNAEMMLRVAEATGRSVSAEIHDEVWATVAFGPEHSADDGR